MANRDFCSDLKEHCQKLDWGHEDEAAGLLQDGGSEVIPRVSWSRMEQGRGRWHRGEFASPRSSEPTKNR